MPHAPRENEIKLAVPDARRGRALLRAGGFRVVRPRVFETNTVFDTPERTLRARSALVRIRQAGRAATLTYKGPPALGRHKSREELEFAVENAHVPAALLERLGFAPVWRYEKYRTEFRRPGNAGTAMLDETPAGVYLELEGTPAWIDRTARALGFHEADYITASYGRLYLDRCARDGVEPGDMLIAKANARGRRRSGRPAR